MAYFDSVFVRTDVKVYYRDSLVVNPSYNPDTIRDRSLIENVVRQDVYKYIGRSLPITNYAQGMELLDVVPGKQVEVLFQNRRYQFHLRDTHPDPRSQAQRLSNTSYANQRENNARAAALPKTSPTLSLNLPPLITPPTTTPADTVAPTIPVVPPSPNAPIDIDNYMFQSEFDTPPTIAPDGTPIPSVPMISTTDTITTAPREFFKRTDIRTYILQFGIDNLVSQVDNSLIFLPYQVYTGTGNAFDMPDLNGLIKVGITDLFEDFRLTGGFRIPLGLGGTEYFLQYDAMKKRLDKRILLYRKAENRNHITHYAEGSVSYPFDTYRSLRFYGGYRNERFDALAYDIGSLNVPSFIGNWLNAKVEFVFDNTLPVSMNILNGSRYKLYAEFQKPFDGIINSNQFELNFGKTGFMGIVGGDFRHYQKVHRQIVWANRFAFAHSFGSQKMLYYLGGVENWLIFNPQKQFDYTNPVRPNHNLRFPILSHQLAWVQAKCAQRQQLFHHQQRVSRAGV